MPLLAELFQDQIAAKIFFPVPSRPPQQLLSTTHLLWLDVNLQAKEMINYATPPSHAEKRFLLEKF